MKTHLARNPGGSFIKTYCGLISIDRSPVFFWRAIGAWRLVTPANRCKRCEHAYQRALQTNAANVD